MEIGNTTATMEFEDEPMDINETALDYFEEGEINSSEDEESITVQTPANPSSIFTKPKSDKNTDGFVTSLNTFEQSEAQKKLERAKRFSLPIQSEDSSETRKEKLLELYKDLRIEKENERHYRFNAVHVRGTENMSTEDVLQYFEDYAPSHVEWINDVSCNVIWTDDVSAASALLNLSKKLINLEKIHLHADPFEKDFKNENITFVDNDEEVDARSIKAAIPPGFWRVGIPCKKSSLLLLRYATRSDKKQRNAEKSSQYYKKYGNPHFGNIPGLISNSLRSGIKKSKSKPADIFTRHKQAEEGPEKKNPWEELAYEWGKTDKVEEPEPNFTRNNIRHRENSIPDLRISLRNKKERHKRMRSTSETSPTLSDEDAWESRSKIPRMKMHADDEEERLGKTLERNIRSKVFKAQPVKDLRNKINRKKGMTRFKFRSEKEMGPSRNSSDSDNEYDNGDSTDWALEEYHDLRESLQNSKRQEQRKHSSVKYKSDSDDNDDDDDDDDDIDIYNKDLSQRSPLQIEIENDEYYLNKPQKK